ncbi:hypothetical protein ES677_14470 [Bizionia gelidisalsuginis]|uniref:Lipoprotein n=1 Tax=Bizionia gelidisalsuginis TaxID=291188 RepID=A0ABY3M729_9FLAO|nr:hypothetical protein [Bizionia gelidisalsuginis]TYC08432.1 hypothetical protein ES677_14470 [Bizionia gelidisalsuginis]
MNRILKIFGLLIILTAVSSCAVKMPLSSNYYSNQKKVGVIYLIDSIGVYREGAQGLLDMALTAGKRFKEPLSIVDKKINPNNDIKDLYIQIFKTKGKPLKDIDFEYDIEKLTKFEKPSSSKKKFHKYDLRFLKDKGIDELLIVDVQYGLLVSYYGMIETGKTGNCRIDSEIIDLSDNSIVFKDFSNSVEKINGKWKTPPRYENLKNSISGAIVKTINLERSKLNK